MPIDSEGRNAAAAPLPAAPAADRAELAAEAKLLVRQLHGYAYSQGIADERDSWSQQDKYDKLVREWEGKASAAIDALARSNDAPGEPKRTYSSQYTPEQRAWCERYERETTFEPLMCDFEAGNESFLQAAKNSRAWFESWAGDAYLRGCDDIPGEMEALHEEITGEKL